MTQQHNIIYSPLPRWMQWTTQIIVVIGLLFSCFIGFKYSTKRLSDFAGYYTSTKIFLEGDSLSYMYNDNWFKQQVKKLEIQEPTIVMYVNPPTVSLLMLPISWLAPFLAKIVWNIISVLLIFVTLYIARESLNIPYGSRYSIVLFTLFTCSIPFLRNLQRGQVYILLLLFVLLLWKGYNENKSWLIGISLATLLNLKYFGWMFIILFAVNKKWKEIIITVLFTVSTFVFGLILFGIETYEKHLDRLLTSFKDKDIAFTGLPSVQALFGGLFISHPQWNPNPVTEMPWLSLVLILITLVCSLIFTFYTKSKNMEEKTKLTFFAILVLSVIFTPLAADHHYILLSLPLFILLSSSKMQWSKFNQIIAIGLIAYLLFGWLPSISIGNLDGWIKLLDFPRLYGAIILWFLLIKWRN